MSQKELTDSQMALIAKVYKLILNSYLINNKNYDMKSTIIVSKYNNSRIGHTCTIPNIDLILLGLNEMQFEFNLVKTGNTTRREIVLSRQTDQILNQIKMELM